MSQIQKKSVDFLALTPGPHLKELLTTLNLSVDIRPQKGQLLVFETPFTNSQQWPVAMLDGEADLIPFNQGKILLGATHENEQAWDLEETVSAFQQLTSGTAPFLKEAEQLLSNPCITASVHVLIHLISLRFWPFARNAPPCGC